MKTKITLLAILLSIKLFSKEFISTATIGDLSVKITLNDVTNEAIIELTGPSSSWFAVGFGNKTMKNTYTIFANETSGGNVSERILGNNSYGTLLNSSITSTNFLPEGNKSKYTIKRPLVTTNGGFAFNAQAGNLDIILAYGPNQMPGTYHGGNKGVTTISLTENVITSINTDIENKFIKAFPNPANSVLNIEWSELCPLTQVKVTTIEGKNVQEFTVENAKNYILDISSYTAGAYFLVIQNNEWRSNFTFIKE